MRRSAWHLRAQSTCPHFTLQVTTRIVGIGRLGRQSEHYIARYLRQTIGLPDVRQVHSVHWNNFTAPFDTDVPVLPLVADDVPNAMLALCRYASSDGKTMRVTLLPAFAPVQVLSVYRDDDPSVPNGMQSTAPPCGR